MIFCNGNVFFFVMGMTFFVIPILFLMIPNSNTNNNINGTMRKDFPMIISTSYKTNDTISFQLSFHETIWLILMFSILLFIYFFVIRTRQKFIQGYYSNLVFIFIPMSLILRCHYNIYISLFHQFVIAICNSHYLQSLLWISIWIVIIFYLGFAIWH